MAAEIGRSPSARQALERAYSKDPNQLRDQAEELITRWATELAQSPGVAGNPFATSSDDELAARRLTTGVKKTVFGQTRPTGISVTDLGVTPEALHLLHQNPLALVTAQQAVFLDPTRGAVSVDVGKLHCLGVQLPAMGQPLDLGPRLSLDRSRPLSR